MWSFLVLLLFVRRLNTLKDNGFNVSFDTYHGLLSLQHQNNHKTSDKLMHLTSEILNEIQQYLTHYMIIADEIGRGAYGRVFKAFRITDGQYVAIKVLVKSSETVTDYKINQMITGHILPHLIKTIRTEETQHYYLIIMQLYKSTLKSYLSEFSELKQEHAQLQKRDTISLTLKVLDDVSLGIQNLRIAVNGSPISLFDVKPGNIFLDEDNNWVVADLGLSDVQFDINVIKGTPLYISRAWAYSAIAEMIPLDAFDVNSLAITGWEILCTLEPNLFDALHRVLEMYQDNVLTGMTTRDEIIVEEFTKIKIQNFELSIGIKELYEFIVEFAIFDKNQPYKYNWITFRAKLMELNNHIQLLMKDSS